MSRGRQPYRYCTIGTDIKPSLRVDGVQPASDVFHACTETHKRVRFEIDIAEFDQPGASGPNQPITLPVDTGITDRAFGIVPDCKLRAHLPSCTS